MFFNFKISIESLATLSFCSQSQHHVGRYEHRAKTCYNIIYLSRKVGIDFYKYFFFKFSRNKSRGINKVKQKPTLATFSCGCFDLNEVSNIKRVEKSRKHTSHEICCDLHSAMCD